jgi:hypothetical protein
MTTDEIPDFGRLKRDLLADIAKGCDASVVSRATTMLDVLERYTISAVEQALTVRSCSNWGDATTAVRRLTLVNALAVACMAVVAVVAVVLHR